MVVAAGMIALSESFRDMTSGVQILDALENLFRSFNATHFLMTGVPLPGRPIEPLIVRANWRDSRPDRGSSALVRGDDPVFQRTLGARRPKLWSDWAGDPMLTESPLLAALPEGHSLLAVPVCAFLPYQAVTLAAGPALTMDTRTLLAADYVVVEAFRRLMALGVVRPERPGELSARERRVVELSATGKTASEIADILEISQRTVHAHLQNASEKLAASNKTHTVVEALRYGQISV